MSLTFGVLFAPKQINNAAVDTIYTVPNGSFSETLLLRKGRVRLANVTGAAASCILWAVPPGGSSALSNQILPNYSIPANSYLDLDLPVMNSQSILQGQASAANSITISLLDGFLQ